jgi:hypothetical protein
LSPEAKKYVDQIIIPEQIDSQSIMTLKVQLIRNDEAAYQLAEAFLKQYSQIEFDTISRDIAEPSKREELEIMRLHIVQELGEEGAKAEKAINEYSNKANKTEADETLLIKALENFNANVVLYLIDNLPEITKPDIIEGVKKAQSDKNISPIQLPSTANKSALEDILTLDIKTGDFGTAELAFEAYKLDRNPIGLIESLLPLTYQQIDILIHALSVKQKNELYKELEKVKPRDKLDSNKPVSNETDGIKIIKEALEKSLVLPGKKFGFEKILSKENQQLLQEMLESSGNHRSTLESIIIFIEAKFNGLTQDKIVDLVKLIPKENRNLILTTYFGEEQKVQILEKVKKLQEEMPGYGALVNRRTNDSQSDVPDRRRQRIKNPRIF